MGTGGAFEEETVVARTWWEVAIVWGGLPLAGAAVGWFAKPVVTWALGLSWMPFRGPLELVESIPEPQSMFILVAAGAILGLVVALSAEGEVLRVAVNDRRMRLRLDDDVREIARPDVGAVYLDGKDIVVLGTSAEELARLRNDRAPARLSEAFAAHGYPWFPDGDPHLDDYRRWVDDAPDLSGSVNAVFKARERALERGDQDDAASLRSELGKLGIVVRDEGDRQHWRQAVPE